MAAVYRCPNYAPRSIVRCSQENARGSGSSWQNLHLPTTNEQRAVTRKQRYLFVVVALQGMRLGEDAPSPLDIASVERVCKHVQAFLGALMSERGFFPDVAHAVTT